MAKFDNSWIYGTNLGQYNKYITIVNDGSRILIMMLQVVASPLIIILMTLEESFTLLKNIYSTGITHDYYHMMTIIYL